MRIMSIREPDFPPPREVTFQDALNAGPGNRRRRILEQICKQEKVRADQLKMMSHATLNPRPPARISSAQGVYNGPR